MIFKSDGRDFMDEDVTADSNSRPKLNEAMEPKAPANVLLVINDLLEVAFFIGFSVYFTRFWSLAIPGFALLTLEVHQCDH